MASTIRAFMATNILDADGVTTDWPFSFAGVSSGANSGSTPYLFPEDVKVEELVVNADNTITIIAREGTLVAPNVLRVLGAPILLGHLVRIFRNTERRFPLVDYQDKQSVSEADLDLANRQAVFLAQEAYDAALGAEAMGEMSRLLFLTQEAARQADRIATEFGDLESAVQQAATAATASAASAVAAEAAAVRAEDAASQMVRKDDLRNVAAAPGKGADMVGFWNRTVHAKLLEAKSIFDFDYEGYLGTGTREQQTLVIQRAIWGSTGELWMGDGGTYLCDALVGRDNLKLTGTCTLDYRTGTFFNTVTRPMLNFSGSVGHVVNVIEDVPGGAMLIKVSDVGAIKAHDIIELGTPGFNGGFVDSSTPVSNAEQLRVAKVEAPNILHLAEPVTHAEGYKTVNSARVRQLNMLKGVHIGDGITILGNGRPVTGAGDNGIQMRWCEKPVLECNIIHADLSAVRFLSCYKPTSKGMLVLHDAKGANNSINYGVILSGSTKHAKVFGCTMANMRHAVITSHLSDLLGMEEHGVVRHLDVYDNDISNTWHAAIATHNDCEFFNVYDNRISGCFFGINFRDRNFAGYGNTFSNCNQCFYLSGQPRDGEIYDNFARGFTGSFLITSFSDVRGIVNLRIRDNDCADGAGGINLTFLATQVNEHIYVTGNKLVRLTGLGGNASVIRVEGAQIVNGAVSHNIINRIIGMVGIRIAAGGIRLQIVGNDIGEISGASFVTLGVYVNSYAKYNIGTSWVGLNAVSNAATLLTDNTLYLQGS